jgi:sorting nexin-1/2
MDSFDDLLEANPFADPFAKRSNSPDPWASPFAAGQGSSQSYEQPTITDSSSHEPSSHTSTTGDGAVIDDPLDSESLAHSEEGVISDIGIVRSPGFKESFDVDNTSFSETATIRAAHSDIAEIPPAGEAEEHVTEGPGDGVSTSAFHTFDGLPPSSPSTSDSHFTSPLQPSSPSTIERSIANLSLGGESNGGPWMTEHAKWSSESSSLVAPPKSPVDDDDSDDDKPIRQTLKSHMQQDGDRSDDAKAKQITPLFVITVDDPQKVGDPIRSYVMYTVHTRTTSPLFQRSTFSVLRRYSDFLWLCETLSANNPGVVVPPVPEKSALNRFDEQFVRQRRLALEKCIQKIANHPVLCKDSDLRMFLESDSFALDIKHRKAEIAHERGGILGSIGQTITGPRFHETDEWFDRQRSYLDGLESQLRGLVKAVDIVAKQRQEVASAAGEFAKSIADVAGADLGQHLSASLAGLAEIETKYHELQSAQAEQDMVTFLGTADEYTRLIGSVRNAFSSRIRVYHSWKNSESDLLRTKQTHERDRAQGRIPSERLAYSLSRIAEAERRAMEAKQEYEHVSKLIKTEMARFEQERAEDFKDSLKTFLEGMLSRQKELIVAWEGYQQMLLQRVADEGNTSSYSTTTATVAS